MLRRVGLGRPSIILSAAMPTAVPTAMATIVPIPEFAVMMSMSVVIPPGDDDAAGQVRRQYRCKHQLCHQ
jgi:hypothetical protein